MADALAEFQRLQQQRDLAAYRAVSQIRMVIDFFEAQDYDSALAQLKKADAEFQETDQRITEFLQSHQLQISQLKENSINGNRTAA